MNNLKEIDLATRMYAGDNNDTLPAATNVSHVQVSPNHFAIFYKPLVMSYAGLAGAPTPQVQALTVDCAASNLINPVGRVTGECQW